ncbi:septal ring lytic transglycosylase RlpA family protein [Kaarinaea lacus]
MTIEAQKLYVRTTALASCLALSACGSFVRDSAPNHYVDHTRVPNATPKVEPRSQYGNPDFYDVEGKRYYVLDSASNFNQKGIASWYGTKFHGRRTSSGEPYSMYKMTAAHKTLPIPVYVEVTNLDNNKKVIVRVNDRGPFAEGRIIDLSYVAAKKLGIDKTGTGRVKIRTIDPRRQHIDDQPAEPVKIAEKKSEGQLYLQVGAFTDHANAAQLLSRLILKTDENVLINRKSAGDEDVYRVRIGPLGSESDAQRIRSQLNPLGIDAPHIVVE